MLTANQREIFEWATDAMQDVAGTDGFEYTYEEVIQFEETLKTSNSDILDDIKYRLLDQFPDVCEVGYNHYEISHQKMNADIKSAELVWDKIVEVNS